MNNDRVWLYCDVILALQDELNDSPEPTCSMVSIKQNIHMIILSDESNTSGIHTSGGARWPH
jgi:hypothetical protein